MQQEKLSATGHKHKAATASGTGMDRRITKSRWPKGLLMFAAVGIASVASLFLLADSFTGRSLHLAQNRLSISQVKTGVFEDFIPLRAKVAQLKTVFLDAVQGGRVEEVLVEDGAHIAARQPILRLSNSDLQLSVMSTESRVMEQLNAMRDQELRLEQNRLNHKRNLVEINYRIRRLEREISRKKELVTKGHISQSEFEDFIDELDYFKQKHEVTLQSQQSDEELMAAQLDFFKEKTKSMEENLAFARKSLEDLVVHAPVSGRLSGFDMEIGQNVPRGERIGQISNPSTFKLEAHIDEYYLGRVDIGQTASFDRNNKLYQLQIAKIYPNVKNGQFKVDMKMVGDKPADMRRGQTIQLKLTLGDANQALLIPNGQFYQDTGGKWIFVLSSDGKTAYKRNIQLGRRNTRFIEVLSGLDTNEKIVTSSYGGFKGMDKLKLDSE